MRFMWLSNSQWSGSGYGQQTRIFTTRLAERGHQIGVICYYGLEGGIIQVNPNLYWFPKGYHPYGNDVTVSHANHFMARHMISLTDVWVMNPEDYPPGFRWIAWYPVDHDPMPGIVRQKLNSAWKRITFSKFGVAKTHEAGLDCLYIPHGVETSVMRPKDKDAARAALGLPKDKYIVGTVAMNKGNPSRKNFWEMLTAFAEFHKRHPDSVYLMQTNRGDGVPDMVNLPELCRLLGLREGVDVLFPDPYLQMVGYPHAFFAELYNALDVHLLVSAGEGFGVPTLEAQACGTPVIVGDWTAHSELCLAGQMVSKKDAEPFYTPQASYQYKPHVGAIVEAMEQEYNHPSDATQAVETIRAEYDADVITEKYWMPTLAEIEAEQ